MARSAARIDEDEEQRPLRLEQLVERRLAAAEPQECEAGRLVAGGERGGLLDTRLELPDPPQRAPEPEVACSPRSSLPVRELRHTRDGEYRGKSDANDDEHVRGR